jgi:cytochrome c oxidase assembly protein subunit 15
MSHPSVILFRRIALFGAVLALCVVVLGAWVRLSAAGLGCPDWPGCYGHLTAAEVARNTDSLDPAYAHRPFVYAKASKEMLHRYFAGSLGLVIVVLAAMALINRKRAGQPLKLPLLLVGLVILQALLGMWTVTLLLKPLIVVLHLIGGLSTLSLLAWLAIEPPQRLAEHSGDAESDRTLRTLATAGLIVLSLQIMLGGWTSSNYAALACPDFPTCQASYWPQMDVKDAFVLWRGLGIDYEGGVLTHPARVAIHFVHRLGAIIAALILGFTAFRTFRRARSTALRSASVFVAALLLTQIILGPLMVLRGLPLVLATAHNAVAALLLISVVRLNRLVRPAI